MNQDIYNKNLKKIRKVFQENFSRKLDSKEVEKIKKIRRSIKNTIVLKRIMDQPLSLKERVYIFFAKIRKYLIKIKNN